MPADERIGRKDQTIHDEHPCEEEMPLSSHRQPFRARDRGPTGEGTAGTVRIAKHSCGVETMPQNRCHPAYVAILCLDRTDRQKWTIAIGTIPPIECGVGIKDLQPAHNENE